MFGFEYITHLIDQALTTQTLEELDGQADGPFMALSPPVACACGEAPVTA